MSLTNAEPVEAISPLVSPATPEGPREPEAAAAGEAEPVPVSPPPPTRLSKDFWSSKDVQVHFYNRTRNLYSRDPMLVLRENHVQGILRGRMNDKKYRCIDFDEQGAVPEDLTPDKVRAIERPFLKPGVLIKEEMELNEEKFCQVAFDLVLDSASDCVCNIRLIFGGLRDNHPRGEDLLRHIKDARLCLRRKDFDDDCEYGVVLDVAEPCKNLPPGSTRTNEFDFHCFAFSTYSNDGDVFVHSLMPENLKVSIVFTVQKDFVEPLLEKPPTVMGAELFLNEETRTRLGESHLVADVQGGLTLDIEDGSMAAGGDGEGVMMQDDLEEYDYRVIALAADDFGDGQASPVGTPRPPEIEFLDLGAVGGRVAGGGRGQGTLHSFWGRDTDRLENPETSFERFVVSVKDSLGEDPEEYVDPVQKAGSVDAWLQGVMGV